MLVPWHSQHLHHRLKVKRRTLDFRYQRPYPDPVANAPDAVAELVDRFERDRKVFQSPDYKEEQLRLEFLNPFFEALGWDVYNKQGWSSSDSSTRT